MDESIARIDQACASGISIKIRVGTAANRGDGKAKLECCVVLDSLTASDA